MCQARGRDRYAKMAAEPVCEDKFFDAYEKCEATVDELQSLVSVLNGSVIALTKQVSRCSAIHQEVFFHQYVRSLLQQLSKLAVPVSVYLHTLQPRYYMLVGSHGCSCIIARTTLC